jgi:RNA polymerase sigma factor (sigma-70 family)
LDPDERRAGVLYEEIRYRLILFFRLHRPIEAEDLADEVLDRVARKLSEGTAIERIEFYAVGVARYVLRERYAATLREQQAQNQIAYLRQSQGMSEDLSVEDTSEALTKCLQRLADADRAMILTYYGADGAVRIKTRQQLAQQIGISLNALHNRALRLRKQLEQCVELTAAAITGCR